MNARLYDPPAKTIPLLMAANGPKAMRRAGQYADGLVTDPKTWKEHKSEFDAGAKAAGKDASKMPVLVEQYVVVGGKADAEKGGGTLALRAESLQVLLQHSRPKGNPATRG